MSDRYARERQHTESVRGITPVRGLESVRDITPVRGSK